MREVSETDLPIFFLHQLDHEANRMAAFTGENPEDRAAFLTHWGEILRDKASSKRTVIWRGRVAGYVLLFQLFGKPSVAYWVGREYWGHGIATHALSAFVGQVRQRPLFARVAKDNLASRRVLEKCGFAVCGEEKSFAKARGTEVEELVYQLLSS